MRYYSSIASEMTLVGGVTDIATSMVVSTVTGLPVQTPFTLVLDPDQSTEEIVSVTSVAGTTLTVTRAQDGSAGVAHSSGATVRHMATAQDFREPQQHIAATTGVHGLSGALVGTTDAQVLTSKTISGASNTLSNIPQSAVTSLVTDLAGKATSSHTHDDRYFTESEVTALTGALDTRLDAVEPVAAAWTAYTPTLTAESTNPNIGSTGVASGAYRVVGKTVHWRCSIVVAGTGISAGTGAYTLSIPHGTPLGSFAIVGVGWIYGASAFEPFLLDYSAGSNARLILTGSGEVAGHTVGMTSSGHLLTASGTYEIV